MNYNFRNEDLEISSGNVHMDKNEIIGRRGKNAL